MGSGALADEYRRAWPHLLGALVRQYGRVELAEDCLQEAYARAMRTPDLRDPIAWIVTAARRLIVDEFRKEAVRQRHARALHADQHATDARALNTGDAESGSTGDDRLDLLVLACHPRLPPSSHLPLALRFVLGAPTEAIADAMLVTHAAMSARLTRAKRTLEEAGRTFGPPSDDHRDHVLHAVLVLYTLGHTQPAGPQLGHAADRTTALEIARAAARAWPDTSEATALVALLLLTEARTPGRTDARGRATTLRDADRSTWDRAMIDEGLRLAAAALPSMGRIALQAGIAGLHTSAPRWEDTDWPAIERLYDRLLERWPSPAAEIARAVAIGYGPGGPDAGLAALSAVPGGAGAVARQRAAAEADLLRLAGRTHEAKAAYLAARALERNGVLQDYLDARLAELA